MTATRARRCIHCVAADRLTMIRGGRCIQCVAGETDWDLGEVGLYYHCVASDRLTMI